MKHNEKIRLKNLKSLPRTNSTKIETPEQLMKNLENTVLELGDLLESAQNRHDPYFHRYQDMLNNMLDVIDCLHGFQEEANK